MKRHGINPAAGVDALAEMVGDDEYANDEVEGTHQREKRVEEQKSGDSWDTEWDSSDWGESGGDPTVTESVSAGWDEEVQWSTDLSHPASSAGGSTKSNRT